MTNELEYYVGGMNKYFKKMLRQLTVGDIGIIKFVSFVFGMLFASWFPRLAKKLEPLFVLIGLILMLPLLIKMLGLLMDVFRIKRRF